MQRDTSTVELYRHESCGETVGTDAFDIEVLDTPLYARLRGECPGCGVDSPIVSYHTYITRTVEQEPDEKRVKAVAD